MSQTLYNISQELRSLIELDMDEDRKADSLDDLKMGLHDKIDGCLAYRQECIRQSEALKGEVDRLSALMKTSNNKADKMKDYVLSSMLMTGTTKHTGLFSASIAKGLQSIKIVDESLISQEYMRITAALDKTKIKNAIQSGLEVAGATIITGESRIIIK